MNNGIHVVSFNRSLNKNGIIILEFYGSSQSLIDGLNSKYSIYLISKTEKVSLSSIEILKGDFRVTQVVFKPVSELKPDNVYELKIDKLPDEERSLKRYNNKLNKWEPLTFTVSNSIDNDKPAFDKIPNEIKKRVVFYGCGPERWIYFNLSVKDKTETLVRVHVRNVITGKATEYLVAIDNNTIKVGHGMCSGGFHFDNGTKFEVIFSLFDLSGNSSDNTGIISFDKPIDKDEKQ